MMHQLRTATFSLISALALCGSPAFAAAKVKGSDQTVTLDCKGGPAIVDGSSNDVRFTGQCSSLSVAGSDNEVTINLAPGAKIMVDGSSNDVNWSSKAKMRPVVKVSGSDNDIVRIR
ncbi:MAG: DUF3060 domain-containing protein [Sphingorhabdus sp.]